MPSSRRIVAPPITLRQLQYLVAIADLGSFRAAAIACGVSQPAISAQVAQVEEQFGFLFFERDRRRILVTPAAEPLIVRARQLLDEADGWLLAATRARDPLSGVARIGVIPTIGPFLLPLMARALRTAFPRLQVQWHEDRTPRLTELLHAGRLDAAIVALESPLGAVETRPLGVDPFVLAVPSDHPLAQSQLPIKLDRLAKERVLLLDDGHCFRDQALELCTRARAEELNYRATSLPTLVQMVASGAGVTLLPSLALTAPGLAQDLAIRRFAAPAPFRTVVLAWRNGAAMAPTLQPLARFMAENWEANVVTSFR